MERAGWAAVATLTINADAIDGDILDQVLFNGAYEFDTDASVEAGWTAVDISADASPAAVATALAAVLVAEDEPYVITDHGDGSLSVWRSVFSDLPGVPPGMPPNGNQTVLDVTWANKLLGPDKIDFDPSADNPILPGLVLPQDYAVDTNERLWALTAKPEIDSDYENDAAAAYGGVAPGGIYRKTGGTVAWRQ